MRPAALGLTLLLGLLMADDRPHMIRVPVLTTSGESLQHLSARVYGNGEAKVMRLRRPADPLMLLVILDTVGDLARVEPARRALAETVRQLPPSTWVGLLRAQDGLEVVLDPTPDRDQFEQALRSIPLTGKAGLLDTVEAVAQLTDAIAEKSAVRVAALYVTDSDVRNYREDFTNPVINSSDSRDLSRRFPEGLVREKVSKVTDKLGRFEAPIFLVHLDFATDRLNQAYQSGLLQIAAATGGLASFCRTPADVPDGVARAVASVQGMYQADVAIPPKAPKSVMLTLDAGGASINYRSRYTLR